MANNKVILVLVYGGIWKSLSTATSQNTSMNKQNAYTSIRSPAEDKAPLYQLQATGPSLHKSGKALTVTTSPQFPKAHAEPSNGSWIAALIIGIILISMIMAIIIILLWKCCKRPVVVDSNWAGRSPFADGDTPDVFMDSDQGTKRSSVLFMLPWKLKQDTNFHDHPTASEKPPQPTTINENHQLSPPAEDCSAATVSVSNKDASPAPTSEAASCARNSYPPAAALSECLDLPPPPDWLREPTEGHSSDPSKYQEFHSEAEEQLPPPPELLTQEIQEPLPQLPQPEHPL
ncbi:protein EVI2A isoform X1 [Falco peregrinus]|uniref:protein EVI2A isoform X1 n=1 Tax=Falco peregrinus TaxID=8954 RepID=UPI000386FEA5|nr:protein EVI2A isoform X1 [Falco peregrinus]XP_055653063.1 protein EVI2A isoform X1 [Falco peregrinus]